jgi:LmbE family N-acetylglucosaminyl deacetylase
MARQRSKSARKKPATRRQAAHPKLAIVDDVPERAMVIFAHPDDAEIGSGGVVARWVAAGCEVTYVLCTNGSAGTGDRSLGPAELAAKRAAEQRAAADFMGVRNLEMLGYADGGLEDTREFRGDIVRALRKYRPHTVFAHDPYRFRGFQHRDHRMVGIATTDAVYPFARDHLHFPEQITAEGLEPHRVRELWYWGADESDVIVDVTDSIDKQVAALIRHESQMPGFSVPPGQTIEQRVKDRAAEVAQGYRFRYGAVFRRLVARR